MSKLLKVILLGDGDVGKSSLMKRYVTNKFDMNTSHTIGVEFLNKDIIVEGEKYTLQIWDTAGQERFRSLRTPFYRGSDICLLVFSLNNIQTFRAVDKWRTEFFYFADVNDHDCFFPFLLLGNKADIPEADRQVSQEQALEWCRANGRMHEGRLIPVPYLETSALNAVNVSEGFQTAVDLWRELDDQVISNINRDRINDHKTVRLGDLSRSDQHRRRKCCS